MAWRWSPGWHGDNRKCRTLSATGKPVHIFQYCRQRLLCEPAFQIISTLAQEHACDSYARQDDIVLSYCDKQLPKKRLTTLNAINQAPLEATVGKRLPVSFHGAPANRKRKQLDAMAVVTRMGKPHLMVTFTANPKWPEIVEKFHKGQTGMDRTDLVNRVFKMKLRFLLADLKSNLFGYMLYVIEYQGRGCVHAHIIIKFEGPSPEQLKEVDKRIRTDLPDASIANGERRKKVLQYMVHKKCGTFNPSAPCIKTDPKTKRKCCKMHYPQPFRSSLALNERSGRAEYRHLDNNDSATIKCKDGQNKTVETTIDNRSIVPYNAYFIMKYDCHICIDMVTGKAVIAYLYKYAYKPADSTRAKITYNGNGIEAYRSVRYISSSEAMWHIFGFRPQERVPTVVLLFVHLPGEQPVVLDEADSAEIQRSIAASSVSNLMKYFGRPLHNQFDDLTYLQYYEQYNAQPKERTSKRSRPCDDASGDDETSNDNGSSTTHWRDQYLNFVHLRSKPIVARLQYMSPDQGDLWYLRLLLLHEQTTTWTRLRTVNGVLQETFEDAARAIGLVHGVEEYPICLQEGIDFSTAKELRQLFTTLVLHGAPACALREIFQDDLAADFASNLAQSAAVNAALKSVDSYASQTWEIHRQIRFAQSTSRKH